MIPFYFSASGYAIFLAKTCHAHLVGVSLEDFTRRSYGMLELTHYEGADIDGYVHQLDEKDDEMRKENIHRFQDACKEAGIKFSVHRDRNVALQELLQESIYADLLIISATETMTRYQEPAPPRFIRELLNEVQCPVVLVPANYQTLRTVYVLKNKTRFSGKGNTL